MINNIIGEGVSVVPHSQKVDHDGGWNTEEAFLRERL